MPDEARLLIALLLAAGGTYALTPAAIAVARRARLLDAPAGYKKHAAPTPYLGGAAVLGGFLLAVPTLGEGVGRLAPIVAFAAVLWVLGTLDDRFPLPPSLRVAVEILAATALWAFDLGWELFDAEALNLVVTNLWIVGLVNAFNLMDTVDGAAATVGSMTALATGAMAMTHGDFALAAMCGALCGACLGFLPYNLAAPSRIFLGDGGSLPIGFIAAASIMALSAGGEPGWPLFLAAILLAGLPVVDTTLVIISRRRSGLSVLTAGRDHLTHRLSTRLRSPRALAGALGLIQGLIGLVAVGTVQLGSGSVVTAWAGWFVAAAATVVLLESEGWAPVRPPPEATKKRVSRGAPTTVVEGAVVAFITVACGVSPFLYGFYDVAVWGPIALLLLAALFGLVVARPASLRRPALVGLLGLTLAWAWALLSTQWAESADQALSEANRWLLYAVLFAILVLLLRDDRVGRVVVASATSVIVALAAYLTAVLLFGDGPSLFFAGRLHEPLGYANGQAGYLLLALWPLIAVAERSRHRWLGAAGLGTATLIAGLAVLGQTRAVVPAVVISAAVLLAFVPGRARRGWCLVFVAAGVAAVLAPLIEVHEGANPATGLPDQASLRTAVALLVLASIGVGAAWMLTEVIGERTRARLGGPALRRLAAGGLVALALVGMGLAVAVDPIGKVGDEARAFTEVRPSSQQGTSRFSSGAGNRYDYWRIAADQFSDHPVEGVGAGNYDSTYFTQRRTDEDVRQPHSLALQTGAELGVVGLLAVALFVAGVLAGAVRRVRGAPNSRSDLLLVVAAGGMFTTWLVHASVDWIHLIPGITGIALCGAAVLVSPWRSPTGARDSRRRTIAVAAAAVVVVLGALTVGRNALADRYRAEARDAIQSDPIRSLSRAGDALALNSESLPALYVRAAAYSRLDDYEGARAALLEATRREPHDFVPWGLLGDLAVRRDDLEAARSAYAIAARLNPRDLALRRLASNPPRAPD